MATDGEVQRQVTGVEGSKSSERVLTVARVRGVVARVLWTVCLVLALVLAIAAFSYALDANQNNGLVKFFQELADRIDMGWFDLDNPVKDFRSKGDPNGEVKNALFNYGIAAVLYLIVGRVLERIIRP
ncbi:hypothetical protein [Nocardioides panacisoli]|uniref:Uncharacterized protein n=1 Tax=Nocardioides panacisoli TaxID=627624 RepID=A0ABP7HZ51_9ACTN